MNMAATSMSARPTTATIEATNAINYALLEVDSRLLRSALVHDCSTDWAVMDTMILMSTAAPPAANRKATEFTISRASAIDLLLLKVSMNFRLLLCYVIISAFGITH